MATEFSYEDENDVLSLSLSPWLSPKKKPKRAASQTKCRYDGRTRKGLNLQQDLRQQQYPLTARCTVQWHVLFFVFDGVLAHITDYPTLYYLSRTCRAFYHVIHRHKSLLRTAFLNLERRRRVPDSIAVHIVTTHTGGNSSSSPDFRADGGNNDDSDRNRDTTGGSREIVRFGSQSPPHSESPPCRFLALNDDPYFCSLTLWGLPGRLITDGMFDVDILESPGVVHGQLGTRLWLPCYGCLRIRHSERHFFADQRGDNAHRSLLGCQALQRRCVDCSIADPARWDRPLRYVQDMPPGLGGYRLRCSACRGVEWVFRRPRGRRAARRLCVVCFDRFKWGEEERERGYTRLYWEEWTALVELSWALAGMEQGTVC